MSINRGLLVVAAILVLSVAAALVYAGALRGPAASPSPSRPQSTAPLVTATPRRSVPRASVPPASVPPATARPSATPVDTSVRASAIVVPQRSADLALSISGVVSVMYVREQQSVVANQILLELDQSTFLAEIDVAEADVARAEAAVERARIALEQLPPEATPGQIAAAEAELRLADAELAVARSSLAEAEVAIRQTELRAPFTGTVATITVELGEQAVAGEALVTIADLSGWLIETTDLSELEVVRVAVGDEASITIEALPDVVLTGRVDRIQVRGTTENGAVRFAVVIEPDEHLAALRWNMSATLRIAPSG